MDENILNELRPGIVERIGKICSHNNEYQKSIEKEAKLFNQLQENLTDEQMNIVEDYQKAVYATMNTCELIAYRQGMKDLAAILGIGK